MCVCVCTSVIIFEFPLGGRLIYSAARATVEGGLPDSNKDLYCTSLCASRVGDVIFPSFPESCPSHIPGKVPPLKLPSNMGVERTRTHVLRILFKQGCKKGLMRIAFA